MHAYLTEINLLLCRNVFIYFDRPLQKKITQRFAMCLIDGGILILGNSESLQFVDEEKNFVPLSTAHRIFQRRHRAHHAG